MRPGLLRTALLGGLLSTTGCLGPVVVDLPREPAASLLQEAAEQRQQTSAPMRFEVVEQVKSLHLEREAEGGFQRYSIPVGGALESTLRALCRAAIASRPSAGLEGEPLRLRVVAAAADCALEQEARAMIEVSIEASLGTRPLARKTARGAGAVSLEGVGSFEVSGRIAAAFEQALLEVWARVLAFLAGLDLPGPGESPAEISKTQPSRPESNPPQETPRVDRLAVGPRRNDRPLETTLDLAEANARASMGDLIGARDAVTTLIERHPDSALAFQRRGALRLYLGELDGALADCFRALELDPQLAVAYVTRAHVYARRGEDDRAREDCEAALQQPHDATVEDSVRGLLEGLDRG